MKHTDFYDLIQKIKSHIKYEIKRALEAHGGSYKWDDNNALYVSAYPRYATCQIDIKVTEMTIVGGYVMVVGEDGEFGDEYDFSLNEISVSSLNNILDYIPEADGVTDVSEPFEV